MKITHQYSGKSIKELLEQYGTGSAGFYPQDWYKDEKFFTEKAPKGTYKITIHDELKNMTFSEQKEAIKDEVCHPAVLIEAILSHYKKTKERLLEVWYVRTDSVDSDGDRVGVSNFGANGLRVGNFGWDDVRSGNLGLASSARIGHLKSRNLAHLESLNTSDLEKRNEIKSFFLQEISTLLTKMVGEMEKGKLLEAAFSPERLAQKQMFNKAKSEDIKLLQDTIEIIKKQIK
jgi:hypothetical protein